MASADEAGVCEITSLAALTALAPEWRTLWDEAQGGPFQSPAWLIPWARRFAGAGVWSLALRRNGRLAALAPMFLHRREDGLRQLTWLGNGLSDHLDLIAADGAAAKAFLAHIEARRDAWDCADLRDVPEDSALAQAALAAGFEADAEEACPVLDLPQDGVAWTPPRKLRDNLRYAHRRAAAAGEVAVRRADAASLEGDLATLFALHAARWAAQGEAGVLADPSIQAFHREAGPGLMTAGTLRIYLLEIGGAPAAAYHGFLAHGRAAFYLGGFDPAFAAFSPGALVLAHAIAAAAAEGARSFDFLRGGEAYKYAWGARDRGQLRLQKGGGSPTRA